MPFPSDPSKYPTEFAALYRRALKESFEIDLGDRGVAINYVHKLHAYRRAVEEANVIGYSTMRAVTIRQRGTRILFDNEKQAIEAMRAAVGMSAPTDDELDSYLAKLEQGMDNDESRSDVSDSPSGEQNSPEDKGQVQVETDYLKLFPKEENSQN